MFPMQFSCKLLLVILYINAYQYSHSTLIDDFTSPGDRNNRKLQRNLIYGTETFGQGIPGTESFGQGVHLGESGYLEESITKPTKHTELHGKAFKMIYSTSESRTCRLTTLLRTGWRKRNLHQLKINLIKGVRNEIFIRFALFNYGQSILANEIAIRANRITIHQIDIINAKVSWPDLHNQPTFSSTFAPKLNRPEDLIDDFRQWDNPTNVLMGDRIIVSRDYQHQDVVNLRSDNDHLIEYFPTDFAINHSYSLCITYSTSRGNKRPVKEHVGIVHRTNDQQHVPYFFQLQFDKGQRMEVQISIEYIISLFHDFRLDSNHGIIIRGPLKIHHIFFLPGTREETNVTLNNSLSNNYIFDNGGNRPLIQNQPAFSSTFAIRPEDLLDDFRQWDNPTNSLKGDRIIVSKDPQIQGLAYLSSFKDYLIEFFPTDIAKNQSSSLCITYSTVKQNRTGIRNKVGIVRRSNNQEHPAYKIDLELVRGQKMVLKVPINYIKKFMDDFRMDSKYGIIIYGPLKIHQIYFVSANSEESLSNDTIIENDTILPETQNEPAFISTFSSEEEKGSADLLDDFRQWHNPTNILMCERIIVSNDLQKLGVAYLSSTKDYLVEYFPDVIANKKYSTVRIIYSTITQNHNVLRNNVGIVRRSRERSYFNDLRLGAGQEVELPISISYVKKYMSDFQIDGNFGIIIRGPLQVHQLVLSAATSEGSDISLEPPGCNQYPSEVDAAPRLGLSDNEMGDISSIEVNNQPAHDLTSFETDMRSVPDLSSFEWNKDAPNLSAFDDENQEADNFSSHSDLVDICSHIQTVTPDHKTHPFNIKFTRFQTELSKIMINEVFQLDVQCLNVLTGSYEKMHLESFRMDLDVSIQFDLLNSVCRSTSFYYELLQKEIAAVDNQLFEQTGDMLYRITPKSNIGPSVLNYYRFAGRTLGMGIMIHERQRRAPAVDIMVNETKFVPMVYKILLNRPILQTDLWQSYPFLHPDNYASSNVATSISNTHPSTDVSTLLVQYAQQLIGAQAEALRTGLYDVIPLEVLAVFDEHELERILMGCPE